MPGLTFSSEYKGACTSGENILENRNSAVQAAAETAAPASPVHNIRPYFRIPIFFLVRSRAFSTSTVSRTSRASISSRIPFIFFLTWLYNLFQVKLANPVELLRGGNTGEKEPRAKWLLVLAGLLWLLSIFHKLRGLERAADYPLPDGK